MADSCRADQDRPPTRIFVIEDHEVARKGLQYRVQNENDMEICGQAANASDGLKTIPRCNPDIAIVDLMLPDKSGLELIEDIGKRWPDLAVLVMSARDESLFAERALRAGALGYVMKSQGLNSLVEGIHTVLRGDIYVSREMTGRMIKKYVGADHLPPRSCAGSLTNRELQVFERLGCGYTTSEIADTLSISRQTVQSHKENIKKKLELENSSTLLQHAILWVLSEDGI